MKQAAALPLAALTALQAVRDHGQVEAGHRVLIIGASGRVGTFAVRIAAVTVRCLTTGGFWTPVSQNQNAVHESG